MVRNGYRNKVHLEDGMPRMCQPRGPRNWHLQQLGRLVGMVRMESTIAGCEQWQSASVDVAAE